MGEDTLPAVTGALLKERRQTVATAESCTGGLVAHYLTDVPGSSDYFLGGIVAYQSEIKEKLLGVSRETIDNFGVVSEQAAMAMAAGARAALNADFGIATTGIAGPDGGTARSSRGNGLYRSGNTGWAVCIQDSIYPGRTVVWSKPWLPKRRSTCCGDT